MNQIKINLEFTTILLEQVLCDDGASRIPLKPICDAIGVVWDCQYEKVSAPYLRDRLGVRLEKFHHGGQSREMVAIRSDRLVAFLYSVDPNNVRGAGNIASADFLERKHKEWDLYLMQSCPGLEESSGG